MEKPNWVSEGSEKKYHLAVYELKQSGAPVTEEAVKALYSKKGGLVLSPEEIAFVEEKKKEEKVVEKRFYRRTK